MEQAAATAGAARDGRQSSTQVTVALISAGATVIAALIGLIVAHPWERGPGQVAEQSAKPPTELSDQAKVLIEDTVKNCTDDAPDAPVNESVTITSPAPGIDVTEIQPMRADVPMRGMFKGRASDSLYVFSYSRLECKYYFNPDGAVSKQNGPWDRTAVLIDSINEKVPLIAAVADRETAAVLQEIIRKARAEHQAAYVGHLPQGLQTARISVHVRPSS